MSAANELKVSSELNAAVLTSAAIQTGAEGAFFRTATVDQLRARCTRTRWSTILQLANVTESL
jgi:hypothetical protein